MGIPTKALTGHLVLPSHTDTNEKCLTGAPLSQMEAPHSLYSLVGFQDGAGITHGEAEGKLGQSKTAGCQTHIIYSSIKSSLGTESLLLLSPEKLPNLQISDGNSIVGKTYLRRKI